jgi:hypothetical protein
VPQNVPLRLSTPESGVQSQTTPKARVSTTGGSSPNGSLPKGPPVDHGGTPAGQAPEPPRFEDGSATTGDVLVGADGAGSHLRAQLLPHALRVETGIVAVSRKLSLNSDVRRGDAAADLARPYAHTRPQRLLHVCQRRRL